MPRVLSLLVFVVAATIAPVLHAVDTEEEPGSAALGPKYAAGKKAIEAKDWNAAIRHFSAVAPSAPANADIQNYLGYAYRNAGKLDAAFQHYRRALELNPSHRGAHEYIGEAYLLVRNLAKAEEHLAALARICSLPCEEFSDLQGKVAAYKNAAR